MKGYVSTHATVVALLLHLSNTHAFAPQPLTTTFANRIDERAAHPPHKNSYLEQLTSPNKEVKDESQPLEAASTHSTYMESTASTSMETPIEQTLEQNETKSLLEKVKQAGTAGAISYALWELGAQLLPILLRMQLFQNSHEIVSWLRQTIKDFGESVFRYVS
jgi:hypothetical protein